ncbi:hypothetical protein HHK36_029052 [Tetracentron sinense]|uniref:Uncharacterized protein n=1 Tax=Tetracentron sinense TaxID=13715 RepID=A0A834YCK8_TETSI|nr:hypothetical protein HHK36_029052 [Tetracentron sinense]
MSDDAQMIKTTAIRDNNTCDADELMEMKMSKEGGRPSHGWERCVLSSSCVFTPQIRLRSLLPRFALTVSELGSW